MLSGLNRTFMELKQFYRYVRGEFDTVLIVPLWNWNSTTARWRRSVRPRLNRTFMELKHINDKLEVIDQTRLNRTFMELKPFLVTSFENWLRVLIVPLWNWNLVL